MTGQDAEKQDPQTAATAAAPQPASDDDKKNNNDNAVAAPTTTTQPDRTTKIIRQAAEAFSHARPFRADAYDQDLLHRAVADAGRWAHGVLLVEVWLLSEDKVSLVRPEGGWWIDSFYHHHHHHPVASAVARKLRPHLPHFLSDHRHKKKDGDAPTQDSPAHQHDDPHHPSKSTTTASSSSTLKETTECQICRLIDPALPNFIPPAKLAPGVGLPGVLWADDLQPMDHSLRKSVRKSVRKSRRSFAVSQRPKASGRHKSTVLAAAGGSRHKSVIAAAGGGGTAAAAVTLTTDEEMGTSHDPTTQQQDTTDRARDEEEAVLSATMLMHSTRSTTNKRSGGVVWRNIKDIINDPDQNGNPRLEHLDKIGLGWAGAVPIYSLNGGRDEKRGMVIYMARHGVDRAKLQSESNEEYLVAASKLVAVALAVRQPRHQAIEERRAERQRAFRRVRERILAIHRAGLTLHEVVHQTYQQKQAAGIHFLHPQEKKQDPQKGEGEGTMNCWEQFVTDIRWWISLVQTRLSAAVRKSGGAGVNPPPGMNWRQTHATFWGVFVTFLMLTHLNRRLQDNHGAEGTLVLGPLGAFVTLVFGLTAAPASQPRNAVLGQVWSLGIALALNQLPTTDLIWTSEVRVSTCIALAVGGMVRLGWTHPPAGAAAVIFATSPNRWTGSNMAVLICGTVMTTVGGAILNNLSPKRQYPTYWGLERVWKKKEE